MFGHRKPQKGVCISPAGTLVFFFNFVFSHALFLLFFRTFHAHSNTQPCRVRDHRARRGRGSSAEPRGEAQRGGEGLASSSLSPKSFFFVLSASSTSTVASSFDLCPLALRRRGLRLRRPSHARRGLRAQPPRARRRDRRGRVCYGREERGSRGRTTTAEAAAVAAANAAAPSSSSSRRLATSTSSVADDVPPSLRRLARLAASPDVARATASLAAAATAGALSAATAAAQADRERRRNRRELLLFLW